MVNEPKDQQEPSMEEILSSIRRIIADEESDQQGESEADPTRDRQDPPAEDDDDVLELTEVVREGGEVVEFQAEKPGGDEAVGADDETPEGEEVELTPDERNEPMPEEKPASPPPEPSTGTDEGAMSAAAAGVAAGAAARLDQAMRQTSGDSEPGSGRTVEQFVADLLRPMLQAWLEENLPPIVERLVQEEIEKLAKRAELL